MIADSVVARLKVEEDFVPDIYLDIKGKRTIGYGTLLEDGISEELAEVMLRWHLKKTMEELGRSAVGTLCQSLPQGVILALLDMAYNMGVPRLLGFEKMWYQLSLKDWNEAARECLDSDYARDLPARASRNAAIIRKGP